VLQVEQGQETETAFREFHGSFQWRNCRLIRSSKKLALLCHSKEAAFRLGSPVVALGCEISAGD